MATLIEVRNNNGLVGRCDAKCYGAIDALCDCVCGGANHGAGLRQAQSNTEQMIEEMLKKYPKNKVIFPDKGKQMELFNV
jgi:hypothetical protein